MIINKLNDNVLNYPDKIALIIGDQSWTYQNLSIDVQKIVKGFTSLQIGKGSHIGLLLANSYEFVLTLLAAASTGAVIVPLNKTIKKDALVKMIKSCDIEYFVVENQIVNTILDTGIIPKSCIITTQNTDEFVSYESWLSSHTHTIEIVEISDDLENANFIISTTSGSTGDPKPIVLTQATKIKRAKNAQSLYALTDQDTIIAATPLYHSLALRLCLLPLLIGATSVILSTFSPSVWLTSIAKFKVSFSILVSSQLANILLEYKKNHTQYCLNTLHTLVSSSALIQPSLKQKLIDTFDCDIHEIYGASEVGVVTNLSPTDAVKKLNTVGRVVSGVDIKIVDESKKTLPLDTVGEIACRSEMAYSGYYKHPDHNGYAEEDKTFYTGDLGKIDSDGFLSYVGRKKEIIITGGINTYPPDIENILMGSGLLKECAVVGVDNEKLGEAIVAVIVTEKNDSTSIIRKLQRICYRSLEDYQQPLYYKVLHELPKNSLGKINKMAIQKVLSDMNLAINL